MLESQLQVALMTSFSIYHSNIVVRVKRIDHKWPCPLVYEKYAKIIVSQQWMVIHKIRGRSGHREVTMQAHGQSKICGEFQLTLKIFDISSRIAISMLNKYLLSYTKMKHMNKIISSILTCYTKHHNVDNFSLQFFYICWYIISCWQLVNVTLWNLQASSVSPSHVVYVTLNTINGVPQW
jgi:hypothetical protein